ncbi:MAG: hypothetical protein SNJ70_00190 [Armatimonadota bacterium]
MSKKCLYFKNIKIINMPGFENNNGFDIDGLVDGINIIYGPNASGKTTTAKSLVSILWPKLLNNKDSMLSAEMILDNKKIKTDLKSGKVDCYIDGEKSNLPLYPSEQYSSRYWLDLNTLMTGNNNEFAKAIANESAGGYDIKAATKSLGYTLKPSNPRGLKTELSNIKAKIKKISNQEKAKINLLNELEALKLAVSSEDEDKKRVRQFEKIKEYKYRKKQLDIVEIELKSYPDICEKLVGNEDKQLEELNQKIDDHNKFIERAKLEIERNSNEKSMLSIQKSPEITEIETLRNLNNSLIDIKSKIELQHREISNYQNEKNNAKKRLPLKIDPEKLDTFNSDSTEILGRFIRRDEKIRSKFDAYNQIEKWIGTEKSSQDLSKIRRCIDLLIDWFSENIISASGYNKVNLIYALLAGLFWGLGILAGYLINPIYFITLLFSIVFLILIKKPQPASTRRVDIQNEYENLNVSLPERWEKDSVKTHFFDIQAKYSDLQFINAKADYLKNISNELNCLNNEINQLNIDKNEILDKIGIMPEMSDDEYSLFVMLTNIIKWQEANDKLDFAENKLRDLIIKQKNITTQINEILMKYNQNEVGSSDDAGSAIERLASEKIRFDEVTSQINRLNEDIKREEKSLNDSVQKKKKLFENIGIALNDERSLYDALNQYKNYQQTKKNYNNILAVYNQSQNEIEDFKELSDLSDEEIESHIERYERRIDSHKEKHQKIGELINTINSAKISKELEQALDIEINAKDKLTKLLDNDIESVVGQTLADFVELNSRSKDLPKVFENANCIFQKITDNRYELEIDYTNSELDFKALDKEVDKFKNINELSTGTRVQLLLSVRLGFIEEQETELSLPLILDEVLAVSDEKRAKEIMDFILDVAKRNRQIIYFTTQLEEAKKWSEYLESVGYNNYSIKDMNNIKRYQSLFV